VILPTACLFLIFSVDAGKGRPPASPAGIGGTAGAPATQSGARPAPPTVPEAVAQIDALYRLRDDRAALDDQRRLIDETARRAPSDYEVLWRAARLYFWLGDDPSLANDARSALGKVGWDYAERAIARDAGRPDGYFWAAVNIGTYALGLGAFKAMTSGLEDKFKAHLQRAAELSPAYYYGGVDVAWGRFYEKLPWPKRDRRKAEQHLRLVLTQQNPYNLRARVFLADTLAHDHRAAEAKRLLDEVAAAPLGRYDLAEERRAKALAAGLSGTVQKLLN
jgi:hypothetical protein